MESSPTPCSSSPRTMACSTASTGFPWIRDTSLRGVDRCAARDPRPRHSPWRGRPRPDDQRRFGADDRRRGERESGPDNGRALVDPGRAEPRYRAGTPTADRERALVSTATLNAIRTERYMYAEYATGKRELYDLQRDPFERLWSRHYAPASTFPSGLHSLPASTAAELCRGQAARTDP